MVARARNDAANLLTASSAEARVEAQSLRLRRREELLERVFAEARARLVHAGEGPEYGEIAEALVREAADQVDSEALAVRADPATARLLSGGLLESIGEDLAVQLILAKPLRTGTGIIVETPDGHTRFDNTLESRLSRIRDQLRAPVFAILAGEGV
jgi:vacuolar-type H+-ATPase subunit E/Vma4